MFGSQFLNNGLTDSEKVYSFRNWFKGFIASSVTYLTFLLIDPENGAPGGHNFALELRPNGGR